MNNQDCGGSFNDSSGWISSPDEDDDGRYDSNADCWWSIDPGPSMKVALSFTLFEVGYWVAFEPCTNDYLEVYEGTELQQTNCGSLGTSGRVSTFDSVRLHFVSDDFYSLKGFNVTYRVLEVICGGSLVEAQGIIRSPDENVYSSDDDMNCKWTVETEERNKIEIAVLYLMIDEDNSRTCEFAFLKIYDGEDILRQYCGNHYYAGRQPIRTETNVMTVQFHADSNYIKAKFNMSYSIIESKMPTYMYSIRYNKH